MPQKSNYINRELSWLSFNHRVMQEAMDKSVPLFERLRFLGIFSNNMDEFFRVRVASLKRILPLGKKMIPELAGYTPKQLLEEIQNRVRDLQDDFESTYNQIIIELRKQKIHFINENQLSKEQSQYVKDYFSEQVRSDIIPIILSQAKQFPYLKDQSLYFAIKMHAGVTQITKYAILEIPQRLPRFISLPDKDDKLCIMFLDDVIRHNLPEIFKTLHAKDIEAYTVKVTRDAELEFENEVAQSYIDKITVGLKNRKKGDPVRFVYDKDMPVDLYNKIKWAMHLAKDDNLIGGGRYHNFKDFISFPDFGRKELIYEKFKPLNHPEIDSAGSIMQHMRDKDFMVHYPYQSFHYFIDLMREAAIDPLVSSIRITLYRVASNSKVTNALINAAKNGKNVVVIIELQARFDEENNIYWAKKLEEEGVKVIFGVKGLKVHSKLCLITRKENGKSFYYANIGTGNYNEKTATLYSDKGLFTTNQKIAYEVKQVFNFFENNERNFKYKYLLVSPKTTRSGFMKLIENEITNAKKGKEAYILLKMNNLVDKKMIDKLYEASEAGVKIRLIIRGICCLITGKENLSENIRGIGVIDRFLEHTRIYIFCNGGKDSTYISSSDWMTRNLDYRIEVSCPVLDPKVKEEVRNIIETQWKDNVKARVLNEKMDNNYRKMRDEKPIRSQYVVYENLKKTLHK
jgi:polyphosphate kinase